MGSEERVPGALLALSAVSPSTNPAQAHDPIAKAAITAIANAAITAIGNTSRPWSRSRPGR